MKVLRTMMIAGTLMMSVPVIAMGQASALPSAQPDKELPPDHGRKLVDQMIAALGGDAWLHRRNFILEGKTGYFYKGAPDPYVNGFVEYYRLHPFAERIVAVTHYGVFIPTDHRDIAVVWTPEGGYEITYKGKKDLPAKDVADYLMRRKYTLDVLVNEWLKQPGVLVTYEGSDLVGRRIADRVSVTNEANETIVLMLDTNTHLPLSRTFTFRDPEFHDLTTDEEQYDDYHAIAGIMTPYTITRLRHGDIVSQRFITKVTYNAELSDDLFDPDHKLDRKGK